MKIQRMLSFLLCMSVVLTGCASGSEGNIVATMMVPTTVPTATVAENSYTEVVDIFSSRDLDASYEEADCILITLGETGILCDSDSVLISDTTATIQKEGTYILSGTLEDGSIIVDTDKTEKVQLVLQSAVIHSKESAPIYIRQADKVFVTLAPDTQNTLSNGGSFVPDKDVSIDGVIFSREDLTLNGSGSLTITSPAGHGIVSKDSLRLTGGSYTMDVLEHGLSGKDEVSIANGSFDITAGKDGIHAENSDDAQLGTVNIQSGDFHINAEGDGISASGNCQIVDGTYTITTGGGSENAQQQTAAHPFDKGQGGAMRPADATSAPTKQRPKDISEWDGRGGKPMDGKDPPQEPGEGQTSTVDTVSTKGIKAANLSIDGGTLQLNSADDGLHANGTLRIRDAALEIATGDDGIHADETVTIASGNIRITESYEGIEGKNVQILGGDIKLTALDDGLNAAGGMDSSGFGRRGDTFDQSDETSSIVIAGGTVNITAFGDGIDANGVLEITDGSVIVSGPTYGDTSVLDYDITGTISGGKFIGTGASRMLQTFSKSTQGTICASVDIQVAGTEILLTDSDGNNILSHKPELDYEIVILSAPEIQAGENYILSIGGTSQTIIAE